MSTTSQTSNAWSRPLHKKSYSPPGISVHRNKSRNASNNRMTSGNASDCELVVRARFLHLLLSLVGKEVILYLLDGTELEGQLETFTPFISFNEDKKNNYVLKSCRVIKTGIDVNDTTNSFRSGCTLIIHSEKVSHLRVADVSIKSCHSISTISRKISKQNNKGNVSSIGEGFMDMDITGKNFHNKDSGLIMAGNEWTSSSVNGYDSLTSAMEVQILSKVNNNKGRRGIFGSPVITTSYSSLPKNNSSKISGGGLLRGDIGKWDQFAANKSLTGKDLLYDETLYTTILDKSIVDEKRQIQAERLAQEIENQNTVNFHVAEERNQLVQGDYDEEDLYSGVLMMNCGSRLVERNVKNERIKLQLKPRSTECNKEKDYDNNKKHTDSVLFATKKKKKNFEQVFPIQNTNYLYSDNNNLKKSQKIPTVITNTGISSVEPMPNTMLEVKKYKEEKKLFNELSGAYTVCNVKQNKTVEHTSSSSSRTPVKAVGFSTTGKLSMNYAAAAAKKKTTFALGTAMSSMNDSGYLGKRNETKSSLVESTKDGTEDIVNSNVKSRGDSSTMEVEVSHIKIKKYENIDTNDENNKINIKSHILRKINYAYPISTKLKEEITNHDNNIFVKDSILDNMCNNIIKAKKSDSKSIANKEFIIENIEHKNGKSDTPEKLEKISSKSKLNINAKTWTPSFPTTSSVPPSIIPLVSPEQPHPQSSVVVNMPHHHVTHYMHSLQPSMTHQPGIHPALYAPTTVMRYPPTGASPPYGLMPPPGSTHIAHHVIPAHPLSPSHQQQLSVPVTGLQSSQLPQSSVQEQVLPLSEDDISVESEMSSPGVAMVTENGDEQGSSSGTPSHLPQVHSTQTPSAIATTVTPLVLPHPQHQVSTQMVYPYYQPVALSIHTPSGRTPQHYHHSGHVPGGIQVMHTRNPYTTYGISTGNMQHNGGGISAIPYNQMRTGGYHNTNTTFMYGSIQGGTVSGGMDDEIYNVRGVGRVGSRGGRSHNRKGGRRISGRGNSGRGSYNSFQGGGCSVGQHTHNQYNIQQDWCLPRSGEANLTTDTSIDTTSKFGKVQGL